MKIDPYNPLDIASLGDSLLHHLELLPVFPLVEVDRFEGSGIYALYYLGDASPYAASGRYNREVACTVPIYVGRAQAPGSRTGVVLSGAGQTTALWDRVREHRRSVESAINLEVSDFVVRVLVVVPIWVPLAEAVVIQKYRPLWNSELQGFGIHAPGGGRAAQAPSQWDILHPGRTFAAALTGNQSATQQGLLERIRRLDAERIPSD